MQIRGYEEFAPFYLPPKVWENSSCYRCGVDFDPKPFVSGAPCLDCQLDFPGEDFANVWFKGGKPSARVLAAREAEIRAQHARNLNDRQIADQLGISSATVIRWRKKLGLPVTVNGIGGFELIKDKDAARAAARINYYRNWEPK